MLRRPTILLGALLGGLTALPLMALLYLGEHLAGWPFVPFDLFDWLARILPGGIITLGIDAIVHVISTLQLGPTSTMAKLAEQTLAGVLMLVIGLLVGATIAVLVRRRASGWKSGAETGASCCLLVVIIEFSLAPAIAHQPLALIWLAGLFTGWGTLLGTILGGAKLRVDRVRMSDVDRAARRTTLLRLVGGSLAVAAGATGLGRLLASREPVTGAGQALAQLAPAAGTTSAATTTAAPAASAAAVPPAPGTRPAVTANPQFYRIDIDTRPPQIDGHTWKLEVAGLFTKARALTLAQLMAYPAITQPITIGCISNEVGGDLIGTTNWTGVRLHTLLQDLGLRVEAKALAIQAVDGFYESVPLGEMLDPRTLLVYGMNGETLPLAHGYPLRIYIPNHYGMKQPKWITHIEALDHDGKGYWVERGWNKEAHPQIQSIIDPIMRATVVNGRLPIGGIAWAGDRGIQKVELQVDGGAWTPATLLLPPPGALTWVLWRYDWSEMPGRHSFRVRATDGTGALQKEQPSAPHPDGATGYHTVSISI